LARGDHFANRASQVPQSQGEPGHHTVAEFFEAPVPGIGLRVRFFSASQAVWMFQLRIFQFEAVIFKI
jgi:hypothetical protein